MQRELDGFFKEKEDADFNTRRVTKSAFSPAQKYLSPEVFLELNDVVVELSGQMVILTIPSYITL